MAIVNRNVHCIDALAVFLVHVDCGVRQQETHDVEGAVGARQHQRRDTINRYAEVDVEVLGRGCCSRLVVSSRLSLDLQATGTIAIIQVVQDDPLELIQVVEQRLPARCLRTLLLLRLGFFC